ncbi:hypothetical protein EEAAV_26555 (plasmid) [Rahnella aceris]
MNITQNFIVACQDIKGRAAVFVAKQVVVSEEQHKEGLHVLYAKLKAKAAGYFEPFVVFGPESFSSLDKALHAASAEDAGKKKSD